MRDNFRARDELLLAFEHVDQQLHGLLLEADPAAIAPKFIAAEVQLKFWLCFLTRRLGSNHDFTNTFNSLHRYTKIMKTLFGVNCNPDFLAAISRGKIFKEERHENKDYLGVNHGSALRRRHARNSQCAVSYGKKRLSG